MSREYLAHATPAPGVAEQVDIVRLGRVRVSLRSRGQIFGFAGIQPVSSLVSEVAAVHRTLASTFHSEEMNFHG